MERPIHETLIKNSMDYKKVEDGVNRNLRSTYGHTPSPFRWHEYAN